MQDALSYLASLRTIIRDLPSQAAQASSLEQFIEIALQAANAEWHAFTRHRLISQTDAPPAIHTTRPAGDVWVISLNPPTESGTSQNIALELTLSIKNDENAGQALWDAVQLWAQIVNQQWQMRLATISQQDASKFALERLDLLEGLSQVAQRVSAELASEAVLIAACQSIVEAIAGIDHVGIVLNDHAPEYGTVLAEYPVAGGIGQKIQLQGYVVYERQKATLAPFVINNVAEAVEELGPNRETLMSFGIKSVMILPLFVQNEFIGSLGLDALKQLHTFTSSEIEVLTAIAAQIAISIQNAQLFEEAQRNAQYQSFINAITAKFQAITDVETILSTTLAELSRTLGAQQSYIRIVPALLSSEAENEFALNIRANDDEWVEM